MAHKILSCETIGTRSSKPRNRAEKVLDIYTSSSFKSLYEKINFSDTTGLDKTKLNARFQIFSKRVFASIGLYPVVHIYDKKAEGLNRSILGSPLRSYLKVHLDKGHVQDKSMAAFFVTKKMHLNGREIDIAITPPHDHSATHSITLCNPPYEYHIPLDSKHLAHNRLTQTEKIQRTGESGAIIKVPAHIVIWSQQQLNESDRQTLEFTILDHYNGLASVPARL